MDGYEGYPEKDDASVYLMGEVLKLEKRVKKLENKVNGKEKS